MPQNFQMGAPMQQGQPPQTGGRPSGMGNPMPAGAGQNNGASPVYTDPVRPLPQPPPRVPVTPVQSIHDPQNPFGPYPSHDSGITDRAIQNMKQTQQMLQNRQWGMPIAGPDWGAGQYPQFPGQGFPQVPADPSQPGGVPAAIPGGPGGPFAGQPAMNNPNSSPIAPRPQAPPVGPPIAPGPSMPGSFPGDPRNPFPGQGQPFQPMGPGHPGAMPQQPPPPPPDYSQDQIGVPGPGGGVIYPGHRRYDEFQQRQQRQQQQPQQQWAPPNFNQGGGVPQGTGGGFQAPPPVQHPQPPGMGQPQGGQPRRMIDGNGGPMPSGVFR